jgi:hypothetical protein
VPYRRKPRTPEQRAACAAAARALRARDPVLARAKHAEWRHKNRDRIARYNRTNLIKCNYGITVADRDAMIAAQGGGCAVCGSSLTPPHVDHCHATGQVRGVLCGRCNNGLGQFRDSVETLLLAALYLARRGGRDA